MPAHKPMIAVVLSVLLEHYVRSEMELNRIPGLALAVVRGGEVTVVRAYGLRSLLTREPMTVDTPVELASLSKPLTALAVAQLVRARRLQLDTPVAAYLAEFRGRPGITVRHLVEHTSGLRRPDDFLAPSAGQRGEFDLGLAARALRGARLRSRPGEAFWYANSNYVLLAAIVERVSGLPFPVYMDKHVFSPLKMMRTTVDQKRAAALGLAQPHEQRWGRIRPSPSRFTGWYGASSVKSTAQDMALFLAALLDGAWENPAIEAPSAVRKQYAMGWFIQPATEWSGGEEFLEHTGSIWGGNTAAVIAPKSWLAAVVLTNAGITRAGPIARGVVRLAAGFPAPEARAEPWTNIPDYWAMCFTVAAVLMLAFLLVRWLRWWAETKRGVRKFTWVTDPWVKVRIVLLLAMAAAVPYALFCDAQPLDALPATLRVALPLLAGATSLLFASFAAACFLPGSRNRAGGHP